MDDICKWIPMRRYRLQKIDPLDVGLTWGLMSLVVLGTVGLLEGLGRGFEGNDWKSFLELPLRVVAYTLGSALGGFIAAIAFNIVSYYTGGITLTFREGFPARPEKNDDDKPNGPPGIGPPQEPNTD